MELTEKSSGSDMGVSMGWTKAWGDRQNWPEFARQRVEENHLDKIVPFIGQALEAHKKKYYSDAAWAKVTGRPQDERTQLGAAWAALLREVGAALDDDPASERAQALYMRWMELAEKTSGGDTETSMGWKNAWADRANWPAHAQQQISSFHLEEVLEFIDGPPRTVRRSGSSGLGRSQAARRSAGLDQPIAALPGFFEARPDARAFGFGYFALRFSVGGGSVGEARGFHLGQLKQLAVAEQVGHAKVGQAGLARAEELAGAAQVEIQLRQLKAVLGADHGVEPLLGQRRDARAGHENAEALGRATAHAAAQLV
jgi:hypothetical protein